MSGPTVDLMTGPLQNHPAVDLATPRAAVVLQDREVIGLDPLLTDAVVSSLRAEVQFQLVTPPTSRLTVPLARLLRDTGGQWVVRRPDGAMFHASTGRPLSWDGSAFVERAPVGSEDAAPDPGWATPSADDQGCVSVEITTLHPTSGALVLGESIETCCAELSDAGVLGWGVAEPVSQRWDRDEFTALSRDRAPGATRLVVVGGSTSRPGLGTVTITPTTTGVREELWWQTGGGEQPEPDRLERLAEHLAAQGAPPRTALVGLEVGRSDGTVEPRHTGATVPYGILLGPAVVNDVGRERALAAPGCVVRLVGPPEAPSLWVRLLADAGPTDPGGVLGRVLAHLGVAEALT